MIKSNCSVGYIECSSKDMISRGIMDALFEVLVECGDQCIVCSLYRSMALMLSCRDRLWINSMCCIEYMSSLQCSRDRLVVEWENMDCKASIYIGVHSVWNRPRKDETLLDLLSMVMKSNPGKFSKSLPQ